MHHFSIRDVENLSGIKAHTLRIWEQRYGLRLCKRKQSRHRYYDNEDIKQVLRIAYLYHNGYKISRIAGLTHDQLLLLASKRTGTDEYDVFINQLVEASMEFDESRFEDVLNSTVLNMGLEKSIIKVAYPFLEKTGLLWMTNHVLPAQEHFSSCLVQKAIITAIDQLGTIKPGARSHFVLFTPTGEEHGIPVLFAQYLLKKQGHITTQLGTNIPFDTLKYYETQQSFTHLYCNLITNFTDCEPGDYLQQLKTQFPNKKIIASGPAFGNVKDGHGNIVVLRSVKEMLEYIKKG